ncbi:MFS transporter [Pseudodesulfovibrio sp. F-1]|uniref:FAD:protein FMN transferase n=1 Tax=Pseudodesulfovibrio alkaliphilus TaxID=2661613 RepID=A0A7K1KMI7_9BACT|nr:MFS transporter [Pseudodesulfovibrio alkaliphilus]MUM77082.1 MFS transporter [Pseudodesulfovibrio alkaliphilus]
MNMAFDDRIRRKRLLISVLLSGFFATLGVGVFSFALPLASLDARIGGAWLGTGFAGFYFMRLLVAPLAGLWADRQGARRPLLAASALGVSAPLIYLVHPSMAALYATQFLLGMVSGVFRPVGMAALGGMVQRERLSYWFAVHALLFNLAMVIGPLAGSALYQNRRVEPVLIGLGVCMVAALLAVALCMPGGRMASCAQSVPKHDAPTGAWSWFAVLLAVAGRTLGLGLVATFYPIHLAMALGHKGLVLGGLFVLPSLAVCFGLPLVARFFGGGCRASLTLAGMSVSALCLFALGESDEPLRLALFGIGMGLGSALSVPSSMALASDLSPRQGRVFGAAHVASGLGFVLGPLLGGVVVQTTHQVGPVFQAAALASLICCLPLLVRVLMDRFHYSRVAALCLAGICGLGLAGVGGAMIQGRVQGAESYPAGFHRYTDVAMGTVVNLTLVSDSRRNADLAARRCIALMRELQADYDHRNPEGSVGRINGAAGRGWIQPTPRAFALIRRSMGFAHASGGAFDPTIGALTTTPFYYMMDGVIARSRQGLVDFRQVRLEEGNGRVRLERQGMALDLGGIAKGAIIDAAVRLLQAQGVSAGMVAAGGDFRAFGDRDWTVGIRHPRAEAIHRTFTVRDQAVCGSGDYEQFLVREDDAGAVLRHHIIDPATMEPAGASIGVTVVADNAETADALATALFVMGHEEGAALLERYPGTAALWFGPDLSVVETPGFPR